jgi:glycosyltransferase involved in cell wall biosynthesis
MKIVQFEDFFHPNAGYNINIFSKYMAKMGHDVVILTSEIEKSPQYLKTFFDCSDIEKKDREYEIENGVRIERLKTHFFYSGRSIVSFSIFKKIRLLKPDIVYIHGNDTYFGILSTIFHRLIRVPIIYDSSMVEMASTNKLNWLFRFLYRYFVAPTFRKHNFKVIRTQDDNYVTKHLGISLLQAPYISLGVDTDRFSPSLKPVSLMEKLNIAYDEFVVVYAGKIDISKGAELLISLLQYEIKVTKNIVYLIIGNPNIEIQEKFAETISDSKTKIIHLPTVSYSELNQYYQISNVAIFPRQISLSFFNAQACGLPVIAESNNINDERLSHGNGYVFEYGNPYDLLNKILDISKLDKSSYSLMSNRSVEYVKSHYDYNDLIIKYINLFENEIINYSS